MSEKDESDLHFWELDPVEREKELNCMYFELLAEADNIDPSPPAPNKFKTEEALGLDRFERVNLQLPRRQASGFEKSIVGLSFLLLAALVASFILNDTFRQRVLEMLLQTLWGPSLLAAGFILIAHSSSKRRESRELEFPKSLRDFALELERAREGEFRGVGIAAPEAVSFKVPPLPPHAMSPLPPPSWRSATP